MRINASGINPQAGQIGTMQGTDSYSKNIQRLIANAQKELQELSSNEELGMEEKMKKRQEIQTRINELNQQLRQHQAEQRREQQQAKKSSMDDMLGGKRAEASRAGQQNAGLSQASMQAMISADSSMKLAQVQGSVATQMEGRARALASEIKTDADRGWDVSKKQEELAKVEQRAENATASQMNILKEAGETLKEASKEEASENEKQRAMKEKKVSETDAEEKSSDETKTVAGKIENEGTAETKIPEDYTLVDVRL